MNRYRKGAAVALFAASTAFVMGVLASPATAAAQTFKQHETEDVTGAVFTCAGGDLTVTAGTISVSVEGVLDEQGVFHITGTIVPHGVTLTDGTNTYTLSGAEWFGGKTLDPDSDAFIEFTDTDHFVIRSSSGGVYAKVQFVTHVSPNGTSFAFARGTCQTPED
jgi:hypothetical protein